MIDGFGSFVNYDLVEYLIGVIGSSEDKAQLKEYKDKFNEYAKLRICECPPKMATTSTDGQSDVCVWNYYSCFDKLTLHDIRKLLRNIADLLEVSRFAIRLCCFGKGCINLTFQVPCFVKQRVFPLTSVQEKELAKLGVMQLTCGDKWTDILICSWVYDSSCSISGFMYYSENFSIHIACMSITPAGCGLNSHPKS